MANLGFGSPFDFSLQAQPLGFGQADMPARRSWQARIFDRLSPTSDLDLSDDDKKAIVRQGFLQLASGLLQSNNFPQALGQGLQGGLLALNQGPQELQERRFRQEQMRRGLLGPAGQQEFAALAEAAGLKPGTPEYQHAALVGLGVKPRAVTGAPRPVEIVGADGRKRQGFADPLTQNITVYDEVTQSFRPLAAGESAAQPMGIGMPPQPATAGMGPSATSVNIEGISPDQQQRLAAGAAALKSAGYDDAAIDMFVQQQLSQPRAAQPLQRAPAPARLAVGRSPEEQAFLTESAQQQAQLSALPQRNVLEAQAAGQKAAAETAARAVTERQQEAIGALPTVLNSTQQTIGLLDQALAHPGRATATGLSATVDPRNYVPGTDASNFQVLLDQIRGQAFLQAFQSLKGAGAITDKEGKAATDAIARLNNAKQGDEAFEQSLRELRTIAENAQQSAIRKAQGGVPQMQAPRAPARKPMPASLTREEQAELEQLRARFGRR